MPLKGDFPMNYETPPARRSSRPLISINPAVLIALFALTSGIALADQPPATRVAKVSLTGLDLSTPDGARAAYERIKTTAQHLCFQLSDPRKVDDQVLYQACLIETLADTVRRINAPTLAALEKYAAER
jgi:UrcA family protein